MGQIVPMEEPTPNRLGVDLFRLGRTFFLLLATSLWSVLAFKYVQFQAAQICCRRELSRRHWFISGVELPTVILQNRQWSSLLPGC
jgi:hypothetical protein